MFIYQNDKMYVQDGDKLVGVEIYPDKVIKVEGTETKIGNKYAIFTPHEVRCRYQLNTGGCYIFPQEEKTVPPIKEPTEKAIKKVIGVDKNVTTNKTEKPIRKSTGK